MPEPSSRRRAVRRIRTVAVFGSSTLSPDSEAAGQAERLGEMLAAAGLSIACGGYGGAMEAVCRGAAKVEGKAVGVTCDVFAHREPNEYLTREVPTTDLLTRITTLMRMANIYIVLDGGIGTLAELFLAWNLLVTGADKPLIVVGDRLRLAIGSISEYTEIEAKHVAQIRFVRTVEEAATLVTELARREDA